MSEPLTKSYVDATDPSHPIQEDLVLYELFERARERGVVGEVVNLETNRRFITTEILEKADDYAKGMLALGLIPGEDTFTVIGCSTMEAINLFTACSAIGVAYAHPYIYTPMDISITSILPNMTPRAVLVGEGAAGTFCTSFLELFEETSTYPKSDRLPFIEHIFYDNSHNDRAPAHKCLNPLSQLTEIGKSVSDKQLEEAKKSVKPEYRLHHLFSSGSTGKPKCIAHSHYSLANELLQLRAENLEPMLTMNPNTDELISYSCAAWVLAGKVSKCVFIPDIREDVPLSETGKVLTQSVIDEGVQYLMIPGSVSTMIRNCILNDKVDFPSIKLFLNGSQIVSRGFKENLKKCFHGMAFTDYGMTETFFIATSSVNDTEEDEEARMQARLVVKPNTQLRIVDTNGEVVDIGKDGMVQVKTYSQLKEYRKQEQLTKDLFTEDGFVKTGDVGVMHQDGTLTIKGRAADAIRFKVLGSLMYPGPIEEAMSQHPAIDDISVIAGSTNDYYGDELTFCIKLKADTVRPTEEELIAYGTTHQLGKSQRPCRLIFMEELCYTDNFRKVSKKKLREAVHEMIAKDSTTGLCNWYKEFLAVCDHGIWHRSNCGPC
ncbi:putative acyl-CoA synthetase YngI [Watersipora subatra]|uniref:putative acyl-CoA synthetase YngI n=1 Tax=Watersipora subatra TaxID=2589382 RepID=UPI00355B797F